MPKARTIWLAVLAALASLALLVPAGSAQAAQYVERFCGQSTRFGIQAMELKSGKACGFWPVAVRTMRASWYVTKGGSGAVCVAVLRYPPGWPNGQPLAPSGGPGGWNCTNVNAGSPYVSWSANNGFGAVYGHPVMLNYSTATIRTDVVNGYLWYYY